MQRSNYNISYAESPYGTLSEYMSGTFRWMFCGLLLTFLVAIITVTTPLFNLLYGSLLYIPLSIAELALVGVLSWRIDKLQPGTATALFFAYAALNGVNLSVWFVAYELPELLLAFVVGSVYFGIMALYGDRTKKDLSGWGPKLFGALITLLIVSVVGVLLSVFAGFRFGIMELLVCAIGLVIFMCFTAYDTQKLRYYYSYYGGDAEMLHKTSIIGALQLYLDYINILIYVLRILGHNKRD